MRDNGHTNERLLIGSPLLHLLRQKLRTSLPSTLQGRSKHFPAISGNSSHSVRAFQKLLPRVPEFQQEMNPGSLPTWISLLLLSPPPSCFLFLIRPLELTRSDPSHLKDFQVVSHKHKENDSWSPALICHYTLMCLRDISNLILPPAVI